MALPIRTQRRGARRRTARERGFATPVVLLFLVAFGLLAAGVAGEAAMARRAVAHVRAEQACEEALGFALALIETRLRRRFELPGAPPPAEVFQVDGEGGIAWEGEYPPVEWRRIGLETVRVRARVTRSDEPFFEESIGRDPENGRPARAQVAVIPLPEATRVEIDLALSPYFEGEGASPALTAARVAFVERIDLLRRGELPPSDLDELAAALALAGEDGLADEELLRALDPVPRLRRTNSHPSRVRGPDRGSLGAGLPALTPEYSGRFLLEAELVPGHDRPARRRSARRTLDLLERVELRFEEDWLAPSLDQPGGVARSARIALGPEEVTDFDLEPLPSQFAPAPPGIDPAALLWRALPFGAIGEGNEGALLVRPSGSGLEVETLERLAAGAHPWLARLRAADDAVRAAWWVEADANGVGQCLVHGRTSGDRSLVERSAPLDHEVRSLSPIAARDAVLAVGENAEGEPRFSIHRPGAVSLVRAGSGTLPAPARAAVADPAGRGFYTIDDSGIGWIPLREVHAKHFDLGGYLHLLPEADPRPARLRAPLRRGLDAVLAGGERIEPAGTLNRGSSVLRGPDLSDLFADGIYLSPLRDETLRFESGEGEAARSALSILAGSGSLLVKPERSAPGAPEPERERILLRLEHAFDLDFHPDAEWIALHHPSHPDPAAIHSITVAGGSPRSGTAVTLVGRRPARGVWFHRREVSLAGAPWVVRVRAGVPARDLPDWSLDQLFVEEVLASEATAPDRGEGGEWQRLEWGFRAGALALLATRSGGGEATAAEATSAVAGPSAASALRLEAGAWRLEIGGELGAKAFRGTLLDLRIDDAPPESAAAARPVFAPASALDPDLVWILPVTCPAGARIRRVVALGDLPPGTGVRWRLEARTPSGIVERTGNGRLFSPDLEILHDDSRVRLEAWLDSDGEGMRTPLIERIGVEWLRAVELRTSTTLRSGLDEGEPAP